MPLEPIKTGYAKIRNHFPSVAKVHAELEFLPAALEVIETPPSPAGRAILWTIIAFFLIALLWACVGKVDIVAVAQGKIVPSGRVKVVQPLEAGVVKAIHVEEGQRVDAGQLLLELDSTLSEADRKRLQNERLTAEFDKARLKALINAVEQQTQKKLEIQPYLNTHILQYSNTETVELSQQRLAQQHNQYLAEAASLHQNVLEQQAELRATDEHIEQLNGTIPLITERAEAIKAMLDSGVVSRADWLKIEEERIRQVKERDIRKSDRQRSLAAIENAKQQQQALSAKYRSDWLGQLTDAESRIEAAEQELVKTEQRNALQKLVAPVSGKVQQLAVHTVGGVVTPAQPLMLIVPDDEAIEVEAWVQNKDIGFVEAGQPVEIKVETFPFTKYGVIDGQIKTLSTDAVTDEEKGLHYVAQVSMAKSTIQADSKFVNLTPGMAVTVEVKTGKRRVIDYLLSPLLRYKEESIGER